LPRLQRIHVKRVLSRESLAIRQAIGDRAGIARSLNALGTLHDHQGEYEEARRFYEEALAIFKQLGSPDREIAVSNLARLREKMGEEKALHL
jgi:tetratricopeptide (TPR) repeat protein